VKDLPASRETADEALDLILQRLESLPEEERKKAARGMGEVAAYQFGAMSPRERREFSEAFGRAMPGWELDGKQ